MKTGWKIVLGIVAAVVLVIGGLGAGWFLWGRWVWMPGMWGQGMHGGWSNTRSWRGPAQQGMGSGMMGGGRGPGMMHGGWGAPADCSMPGGCGYSATVSSAIDVEEAEKAVEAYIRDLGYGDLEIAELMEFELNFYAIVRERDTGVGAMELLIDKNSGAVGPEMGPNMMWNARYGMHNRGRMMNWSSSTNSISEDKAVEIAQGWLDENMPGATAEEHADPFYGYYTIHTMRDSEIEGMLSVHGTTGQVWYHTWHGGFVQMIEHYEDHG